TALLYHGIGVKECYYSAAQMSMDVRFAEGEYRVRELKSRYPQANVIGAGFAKLDPLFGPVAERPTFDLQAHGLQKERPTVLYAPTYYPSSLECLPDNWPETLADCNLLIKAHHFSLTKSRYRSQARKLDVWKQYPNTYVADLADYSLLPFMGSANLLVSEASSALFEFAALGKPVVWCDFMRLRWGHRGLLRFRFEKRMDKLMDRYRDIGAHADSPDELAAVIRQELANPEKYEMKRREYTESLIGATDGKCGRRIADFLLAQVTKKAV
ncbi:MAG: CDP-glycerol glycerophosphotransferase family protein, partial [Gammaproteobacteria bacterium]|nr:CDP-glycerol glycerophosphotransferase family protein [Gammaproteobacteria bacterium]